MFRYDTYESPLGTLWLTGEDGVLTGLSFVPVLPEAGLKAPEGEFDPVKQWLDGYFRGESAAVDFSMELRGTPFQKLIWNLLLNIPYGQTRTYGTLAKEAADILGKEKMSSQAVGQAVGRNPVAIIVPCHRVVGAGGKLTGYAYDIETKSWLLRHEQKREVT